MADDTDSPNLSALFFNFSSVCVLQKRSQYLVDSGSLTPEEVPAVTHELRSEDLPSYPLVDLGHLWAMFLIYSTRACSCATVAMQQYSLHHLLLISC